MGRLLAIDYGLKRTGLAATDPLRIIASALETVDTTRLIPYLKNYFEKEAVDEVVIGLPKKMNNQESDLAPFVHNFIESFKKHFPQKTIVTWDERFTSRIAQQALIASGVKKKERQIKGNVDKISATIILQEFLNSKI